MKVKLSNGKEYEIKRLSWGERLEAEEKATIGTRLNERMFNFWLVHFATSGGLNQQEYFSLDQQDGYTITKKAFEENVITRDFLAQSKEEIIQQEQQQQQGTEKPQDL